MTQRWRHALSENPLEQAGPFLSARECPVLWLFVLAHVSPRQVSSFSFYPSFYHPCSLSAPPKSRAFPPHTGPFVGSSFVASRRERGCKVSRYLGVLQTIWVLLSWFPPRPGTSRLLNELLLIPPCVAIGLALIWGGCGVAKPHPGKAVARAVHSSPLPALSLLLPVATTVIVLVSRSSSDSIF